MRICAFFVVAKFHAAPRGAGQGLLLALGLAQTSDAVALFPLAALFQKIDAFKTLENVTLFTRGARGTQTSML
jgi:hypothetical protein